MNLKEKRLAAGMTQQQLADAAGLKRNRITMIEKGHKPRVEAAKKIAAVLGFEWYKFFEEPGVEVSLVTFPEGEPIEEEEER